MIIKNGCYKVSDCTLYIFDDLVEVKTCSSTLFKSPNKQALVFFFLSIGKSVYLSYTSSSKEPKLDDQYYLENYSYLFPVKFSFSFSDSDLCLSKSCE